MIIKSKGTEVPAVKISMTMKLWDPSSLDINDHLKFKNTVITKELINNFQNNLLEPVLFERIELIRLSRSQYLVTSFVDFAVYKGSFAGLLTYYQLLLQNAQDLMETIYPHILT